MLAGTTPVLVHNSACDPLFEGEGFQHALRNHVEGSSGARGKTVFATYNLDGEDLMEEVADLITDAVRSTKGRPNWPDQDGNPRDGLVHTYDFDYPVGYKVVNGEKKFTDVVEVIVNEDGSIRTAYPLDPDMLD